VRISAVPDAADVDLEKIDLFDPLLYSDGDPHPIWTAMRQRAPLHRQVLPDGRQFWSVTRHGDACRVLSAHREFSSERGSLLHQLGKGDAASGKMLVSADPPRHSELRGPLNRMFSAKAVASAEPRIRRAVLATLPPPGHSGPWDVATSAALLPMAVAASFMAFPEEDWVDLVQWTSMAAAPEDPSFRVSSPAATLAIAHHQLFDYFAKHMRHRRANPGEDVVSYLTTMRAGSEQLTDEEVVYNCYSLLLGANATTPHTVAGTILAMAEHAPHFLRHGDADGTRVPLLIEEGLRWTSPASSFLRHAVQDVTLSGGTVREGDAVVVWVGSANRDEEVFSEPFRFDLTRDAGRHIAFGFGPHYCLGSALARIALRIYFSEFLRRFAGAELAGDPVHLRSNFIAGLVHLPMSLVPRAGT